MNKKNKVKTKTILDSKTFFFLAFWLSFIVLTLFCLIFGCPSLEFYLITLALIELILLPITMLYTVYCED